MRHYYGVRGEDQCHVFAVEDNGDERALSPRLEIRNHSPDGFNWGYTGSGPAQLALAIMADYLGRKMAPPKCPYCAAPIEHDRCTGQKCGWAWSDAEAWRPVMDVYQEFKREVVMTLAEKRWTLTGEQVRDWLAKRSESKLL